MKDQKTVDTKSEPTGAVNQAAATVENREAPWAAWRRLFTERPDYKGLAVYVAASVPGTYGALQLLKLGPAYSLSWLVGTLIGLVCLPGLLFACGVLLALSAVVKLLGLL